MVTATSKQKKKSSKISPQAKRTLANIFGSLVSNRKVIDAAKELPFYYWIIFLVLSIFLPAIPTMVRSIQSYGSSFLNSTYTYSADTTIPSLTRKLKEDGIELKINNDNKLLAYKNNELITGIDDTTPDSSKEVTPIFTYSYIDTSRKGDIKSGNGEYTLRFVYTTDEKYNDVYKSLTSTSYYAGSTTLSSRYPGLSSYTPSFLIVSPSNIFCALYKVGTSTAATTSYSGSTFSNSPKNIDLVSEFLCVDGATNEQIYSKWRTFFDQTFVKAHGILIRNNLLIYCGIYASLIALMGALLFVLTRGKRNPFRYLNYYICAKTSIYAALSPAILAMALGFALVNQIGQMLFIVFFGIRIMWLSMKQLRPL